jgi:chromosome segregation ATPase
VQAETAAQDASTKLEHAREQLKASHDSIARLEGLESAGEAQRQKLAEDLAEAGDQMSHLRQQVAGLSEAAEAASAAAAAREEALKQQLDDLRAQLVVAQAQMLEEAAAHEQTEAQLQGQGVSSAEICEMQERLEECTVRLQKAEAEKAALSEELNHSCKTISDLQDELESLRVAADACKAEAGNTVRGCC